MHCLEKLTQGDAIPTKAMYNDTHCQQEAHCMKARKAKRQLHLYREPNYMGGLCVVCRKRQRDYKHLTMPHMCEHCRSTRQKTLWDVLPASVQQYSRELEEKLGTTDVQILNIPNPPPTRTRTQQRPTEYGADVTTPKLDTPSKVSDRVAELMAKLKDVV
jgi:hypothetical protein